MSQQDCLFCKIVEGQIPAKKIHDDELCIGFVDINPQAPTHVLFVPRRHIATVRIRWKSSQVFAWSIR